MQNFLANTRALGNNMGQFSRDFGPSVKGQTPGFRRGDTGGLRNDIPGRFNTTPGAPMRRFETSGFRHEGMNDYAPPYHETEESNPRVTIQGRRIIPFASSSLQNADLAPPSERQLLFTWRARPAGKFVTPIGDPEDVQMRNESLPSLLNSMFGATSTPTRSPMSMISVQAMPTLGAAIEQLNFAIAELCALWAEASPEAYQFVTPDMLHYGCRDLKYYPESSKVAKLLRKLPGFSEYEGFACEGIPRNVIADDGTGPKHDDGGIYFSGPGGKKAAKGYTVAVTTHGTETCRNYWGGNGVKTGNYLYIVFKKFKPKYYDRPADAQAYQGLDKEELFEYHLANKQHDSVRDPAGMRRTVTMKKIATPAFPDGAAARPPQYALISSQHTLTRSAAEYEDEWGQKHMGVLIALGKVQFAPATGTTNPPLDPHKVRPYMDNRFAMDTDPCEVLLTLDDGFSCAY